MINSLKKQAILLTIVACFLFAVLTCMLRIMTFHMTPYQITAYKAIFNLLILLPIMVYKREGFGNFNKANLLHGLIACVSTPLWVFAIQKAEMSQIIALTYTNPLFSAILASIFLKEVFNRNRYIALLLGVLGSYIVVGYNLRNFNPYALLSLIVAFTWSVKSIIIKKLSNKQSPFVIIFYLNSVVLFFYCPVLLKTQYLLNVNEAINFLMVTIVAIAAQSCLTLAYKKVAITLLLPLDYLRIVFVSILAFILFNEMISIYTIIGSTIIIVGSVFIVVGKKKSYEGTKNK